MLQHIKFLRKIGLNSQKNSFLAIFEVVYKKWDVIEIRETA